MLVLVYQAGIANLFRVSAISLFAERRGATDRIYQGDFRTAEAMARGAALMGATVRSAYCNLPGDIAGRNWESDLRNAPFSEKFRPVRNR